MKLKSIFILIFILVFVQIDCIAKPKNKELVLLAEVYHCYHARESNYIAKIKLNKVKSLELQNVKSFIAETVKSNNNILSTKYLKKPDLETLNYFYIILGLNYNMFNDKKAKDKDEFVIEKYSLPNANPDEMLVKYYNSIFGLLVNKNSELHLGDMNFDFEELDLKTNKEKAIFFLVAFERLGFLNNRAIYLPDSITLDKPSELIKYYPEFNGKLFYKFNDFDFDDFLLTIDKGMPKESFKNYYLAKYKKLLKYLLIDN